MVSMGKALFWELLLFVCVTIMAEGYSSRRPPACGHQRPATIGQRLQKTFAPVIGMYRRLFRAGSKDAEH
jgi:hypothetical protein